MGFGTDFENPFFVTHLRYDSLLLFKFPTASLNFMQNCMPIPGVREKMTRRPSHENLALINC